MDAQMRRAETSRLCIHGRTDAGHNPAAVGTGIASSLAGRPSPATATGGFMGSTATTAKRERLEDSNPTVDNKRARTQRRLSLLSLPQDIVSRIISELPFTEAVRMSTVCSKLRRAWMHHSNLDLGVSSAMEPTKAKRNQSSDRYKRMLGNRRFVDTVNVILMKLKHRGLTLNRFAVTFELWMGQARHIDGWVSFALASKAKVLSLDFSPYHGPYQDNYSFPFHLFDDQNASCIRVLQLHRVNIGPASPDDICVFANLRAVSLEHAVSLQDLHHFLLKCPALEWLSIRGCSQLDISLHCAEPLPLLKFLCVQDSGVNKIELRAPNLTTFGYGGRSRVLVVLHESLMLKTASFAFRVEENLGFVFTELPTALPHVESLHVRATVKTQIHGFTQAPLKLTNLKHLSMELFFAHDKRFGKNAILQLAYLLEVAPSLVDLHWDMFCSPCPGRPKGDVIVDRPHCNLKRACLTGFIGNGGQVALARYILRNAVRLERLVVDPKGRIEEQMLGEFEGRRSAMSKLASKDKKGVLTIL